MKHGLTLIEILLAIVILGVVVAILGETARNGIHSASSARDTTQAELICESIMGMIRAGLIPLESQSEIPLESDYPDTNAFHKNRSGEDLWRYTIDVFSTDTDGLLEVAVTVRQTISEELRPVECRLIRWMIDPEFLEELEEEMNEILNPEESETSTESSSSG